MKALSPPWENSPPTVEAHAPGLQTRSFTFRHPTKTGVFPQNGKTPAWNFSYEKAGSGCYRVLMSILLIDDDEELCELLSEYLGGEGWEVESLYDGPAGLQRAVESQWDAVILDIMLPGLNGLDLLRKLREKSDVPVIMLTARGEEVDRILGLELGADDYLPKPFNPRELSARIRAVLRRSHTPEESGKSGRLRVGDLSLDPGSRSLRIGDGEIYLTSVEFELLELMLVKAGEVVTREALSLHALGRRPTAWDRALDTHMSNLRKKLGPDPEGRERLRTIRGIGYQYLRPGNEGKG